MKSFYQKLANLAVNYSLGAKKDQRAFVLGPTLAKELFQALYVEILKAGAHPLLIPTIEGEDELLFKHGSEEQLIYIDEVIKTIFKEFDCQVYIFGDYNTRKLSLVDPKLVAKFYGSQARREINNIIDDRYLKGEYKWVGIPFPSHSLAQEANMDLFSYFEFVERALFLDKEDPVKEWKEIEKKQNNVIKILNTLEKINIIGEDTDLSFSLKGRIWENCCGHENLPDGEVCTCPVEDSVNGHIRFTYPGIYLGKEIENIYLELKDGKVTKATADKAEDLLQEIILIENANIFGEFAIGTNYGITDFTKNMLFDEKIGGTLHCALGSGFPECGGKNESAIHWDILKDMKPQGSKIIADGKIIYEEGQWKI
ncbi:MAG: aminopeptidase [Candidatus Lokiarchaeota archaeon]|nr:aminopeptidase [Candidatus Lokiarchaeota archaeon]